MFLKGWKSDVLKKNKTRIDVEKPVVDHLAELRYRLIIVIATITVMTVFLYSKVPIIVSFIKKPIEKFKLDFAFFSVTEGFVTRFKLALILSTIIFIPLIVYQVIAFVGPGLKKEEKKLVYKTLASIFPVFILGAVFGYIMIVPTALNFLITFGNSYMTPVLSGDKYLVFIMMLSTSLGISFTIPVILIFLVKLKLLTTKMVRKTRKYILLAILIGEGIIVSDFSSFIIIAIPIIIVFEIGVFIARVIEKKDKKDKK